jgi:hypothetical protein
MSEFRIVTAADVDPERLHQFLLRAYGPTKSAFLRQHGRWWHAGDRHRLVVARGEEIAGYCAVIPTRCRVGAEVHDAVWWVDLIVMPEFRGLGLQRLLDAELRAMGDLKLGFPNPLAAPMHRRHGWGVREDFRTLLLPLAPTRVRIVQQAPGVKGTLLRAGAAALTPLARLFRGRLARYRPVTARVLERPDAGALAAIFTRHGPTGVVTTARDAEFLRWRYLDAPYRAALTFYVAGPAEDPSLALIARLVDGETGPLVRILDCFGHLDDTAGLRDVVSLCLRDAARARATQVTFLASLPRLRPPLRALGFVAGSMARFCWHSHRPEVLAAIGAADCHFGFGDSDNDDPG